MADPPLEEREKGAPFLGQHRSQLVSRRHFGNFAARRVSRVLHSILSMVKTALYAPRGLMTTPVFVRHGIGLRRGAAMNLMLTIAVHRREPAAILGQAARIVLGALGSIVGSVPTGNTGGTNIRMFKHLPIASELLKIMEGHRPTNS